MSQFHDFLVEVWTAMLEIWSKVMWSTAKTHSLKGQKEGTESPACSTETSGLLVNILAWTKTLTSFLTQTPVTTVEVQWSKALWELVLLSLITLSKPLWFFIGTLGTHRVQVEKHYTKMHLPGERKQNKTPTNLDLKNLLSFYRYKKAWNPDDTVWLHVSQELFHRD